MAIEILDPHYIPAFSLETVVLDKDTGAPLSGGLVYFFEDNQRTTPKNVYQITGTSPNYSFIPLPNPMVLSSIGTFVDALNNPVIPYFYPYDADLNPDYYYVRCTSANSVFQWDREADPYIPSTILPENEVIESENQVSNPQFVQVSFSPVTGSIFNLTGTNTVTNIAPDWQIVTSGSGTLTIAQVPITATNIETQPPYVLDITTSGSFTNVSLVTNFNHSPKLFAGGNLYASFIGRTLSGGTPAVSLTYVPSSGSSQLIVSDNLNVDGNFHTVKGNVFVASTNTDPATTGYCQLYLTLPVNTHIQVSSFMMVSVSSGITSVPFPQESTERQIDHLFHDYYYTILVRSKSSLLSGWYFSLNPYQFISDANHTCVGNEYIADQTIIIQQNYVQNGAGGLSNIQRQVMPNLNLKMVPLTAHNQFGLIQYIDCGTTFGYWGYYLSALVRLQLISPNNTTIRYKVRLFYNLNIPNVISQTDPILSWTEGQDPQFNTAAGYIPILAENDPVYIASNGQGILNIPFNRFTPTGLQSSTQTLGIMFYTVDNMSTAGTGDYLQIDQISLIRNDFAMQVNPETYNQTLEECQQYYESTYPKFSYPAFGAQSQNQLIAPLNYNVSGAGPFSVFLYGETLNIPWKTIKRITNPSIAVYSVATGTAGNISISAFANNVNIVPPTDVALGTFYSLINNGDKGATYRNNTTASMNPSGASAASGANIYAFAAYHATIDARIGVAH